MAKRLPFGVCCLALAAGLVTANLAVAGTIEGTVVDASGKPQAGVQVSIPAVVQSAVTGADGRFRFEKVPQGEFEVQTSAMFRIARTIVAQVPADGSVTINPVLTPNTALAAAAAMRPEPAPEHLAQKSAYLSGIRKVDRRIAPNIVVILFDDLGYGDLSSYGNKLTHTPRVDRFAAQNTLLTNAYSASPVCTPSRTALLTGRLPARAHAANHVFFPSDNPVATMRRAVGWANAIPVDEILLPEVLSRAGYATGMFGKWHLGDTAGHRPTELGFGTYFGVLYSNDMVPLALYRGTQIDTSPDAVSQDTLNERFADEAISFIQKSAGKPFFAYIPFTGPHWPHHVKPELRGKSAGGLYGDVVEDLDTQSGRILDALSKAGLDENTIVIITSDNGADHYGSAGDLRGRKGETWEGGMRVPAIIRWPGVTKPASVIDGMTMNFDYFASVLAAAGIKPPADRAIDGMDIRPMLAGSPASPHKYLYYTTTWQAKLAAVRDARFKYREPVDDPSPLGASHPEHLNAKPALYDLLNDYEAHDVATVNEKKAGELAEALRLFRAELAANPRGWRLEKATK